METTLSDILEKAQTWPEEARRELIRVAEEIDREQKGGIYILSPEERADVEESAAEMDAGRFASDEDVEAVFARFR